MQSPWDTLQTREKTQPVGFLQSILQIRTGVFAIIIRYMPTVSVVIVSWNTCILLESCLRSLYNSLQKLRPEDLEVWVVDNASTDGSLEMIAEKFSQVRPVSNPENVGFAAGNNQAIRSSQGDYILLLNPDTEVLPGAIDTLLDFMEVKPIAGAAGALLLNPDHSLQTSCYPFPTLGGELWRLLHLDRVYTYGVYDMQAWPQNTFRAVDDIQGACLMLRRQTLDRTGLMDESYFMYTEEVDLCYRIKQQGWENYWVPQAKVVHFGGQSTSQVAQKMFLCLYQSKLQFFRKHYGRRAALGYKMILLLVSLLRLLAVPFALIESREKRQQHFDLAKNYRMLLGAIPGW
jgi:N-acetylglucosaminyl-diphospho-decaprenol L-rhamnosyltransferase